MYTLITLISGHFIGDWAFQDDWFAQHKKTSHEIMFYHIAVYVSAIFLATAIVGIKLSWHSLLILFISHFIIDTLSSRMKLIKKIWLDQLFHILIIVIIWLLL